MILTDKIKQLLVMHYSTILISCDTSGSELLREQGLLMYRDQRLRLTKYGYLLIRDLIANGILSIIYFRCYF